VPSAEADSDFFRWKLSATSVAGFRMTSLRDLRGGRSVRPDCLGTVFGDKGAEYGD
jgi:hypothetical protein